jgi:hypothetical protein
MFAQKLAFPFAHAILPEAHVVNHRLETFLVIDIDIAAPFGPPFPTNGTVRARLRIASARRACSSSLRRRVPQALS